MEHLSPRGSMRGTWRDGSFTENPERYAKQGSGNRRLFHWVPLLGNMKGRSFLRIFDRRENFLYLGEFL